LKIPNVARPPLIGEIGKYAGALFKDMLELQMALLAESERVLTPEATAAVAKGLLTPTQLASPTTCVAETFPPAVDSALLKVIELSVRLVVQLLPLKN
jgi:hypothetical protein